MDDVRDEADGFIPRQASCDSVLLVNVVGFITLPLDTHFHITRKQVLANSVASK